ncbi:tripartite motif-containing protein 14-like [Petromyzon marinus]|uniref:tripartite motif-containing protein 14-like n=1 Tax=Petromyzon marinus TaxID=7757 RepID=UPI003F712558
MRFCDYFANIILDTTDGCSPTLNPNSANKDFKISSDLKTVTQICIYVGHLPQQQIFSRKLPALCTEGFLSGQHYWEVDVRGVGKCRIRVTYGTFPRKQTSSECLLGANDFSWSLAKQNNSCSVWHGGVETSLSVPEPPRRVGVHLDWDMGLLSFYSADSMTLLHSFYQTFTQPLYPGLWVVNHSDSVTIVDLSHVS